MTRRRRYPGRLCRQMDVECAVVDAPAAPRPRALRSRLRTLAGIVFLAGAVLAGAAVRELSARLIDQHVERAQPSSGSSQIIASSSGLGDHGSLLKCDVLLCGMSGVGKSTLLHNAKVGTVEHACFPVPSEWRAFVICAEILTRPLDGATTTWMVRGGLPGAKPNGPCAQVRGGLTIARTFCR